MNTTFRLVAEIAQAHEGSLGQAHAFIDAVYAAGVKDIKFQMHFAEHESSKEDKFRVNSFPQDLSRYDYWKRMQFSPSEWNQLHQHCIDKSVNMIMSPFSSYAIDLCNKLRITSIKLGSGETNNYEFFRTIKTFAGEIILSSGLSNWQELDDSVSHFQDFSGQLYLLQCTSKYPCKLNEIGINIISEIDARYSKVIPGLSDHSGSIIPTIVAASQGKARMSEVHVCFSKQQFGPDTSSSITIDELRYLNQTLPDIHMVANSNVNKDDMSKTLANTKSLFVRSLFSTKALPKGHILTDDDLVSKKPGFFVSSDNRKSFVGKKLLKDIDEGVPLNWEDI